MGAHAHHYPELSPSNVISLHHTSTPPPPSSRPSLLVLICLNVSKLSDGNNQATAASLNDEYLVQFQSHKNVMYCSFCLKLAVLSTDFKQALEAQKLNVQFGKWDITILSFKVGKFLLSLDGAWLAVPPHTHNESLCAKLIISWPKLQS